MNNFYDIHIPVMPNEVIENLNIKKNGIYIDGTFGTGGHSKLILNKLGNKGILIVLDKDIESINFFKQINDKRMTFINNNFSSIKDITIEKGMIGKVNGILLDLGISKYQIKNSHRGFSFMENGFIDMRMNNSKGISAYDLLNNYSKDKISLILNKFGEEKISNSKKIAKNILIRRKIKKITQTIELKNIILNSLNNSNIKNKFKSVVRCFQAIRIYINNEIEELKNILKDINEILAINGIFIIISFHSLEDRVIKHYFNLSKKENLFLKKIPLTYNEEKYLNINNKYSIKEIKKTRPSIEEISKNISSRSAILRVFKKVKNL